MSKYKVGDKFVIEIAEVYESEPFYKIKGFNSLVFDKNVLDRLEKIENKEKSIASENIRVGDVVTICDGDIKFICTKDNSSGDYSKCHLLSSNGSVWEDCNKSDCKKVGKNIDINDLLEMLEIIYK